jgi:hypothetical protein
MPYSYERQGSAASEVKTLSPKFHSALKKAISEEKNSKVKAALKEALEHFEQVIDNLKVAEHEDEQASKE